MSGRIRLAEDERDRPPEPPQEPPTSPEALPPPPQAAAPEERPERPQEAAHEGEEPAPELSVKSEPLPPEIQKRIDRENREKWEARREADLLRQRVAEYERAQPQPGQPASDAEERAYQRLAAEQRQQDFNRQCNEVYRKGQAEYQDFDEAVRALNATGWGNRPDALMALTSMPDAHKVYRELASNLDNAGRILQLPPMQMAMELARMATAAPTPAPNGGAQAAPQPAQGAPASLPPVTQAPAPIRPVGGTTRAPERPLDKVSMAEFIRRRDREESQSRIRR
jgi:hypothetical protein